MRIAPAENLKIGDRVRLWESTRAAVNGDQIVTGKAEYGVVVKVTKSNECKIATLLFGDLRLPKTVKP